MKLINEISDLAWEIMTGVNSWTCPYRNKTRPTIEVRNNQRGRYRPLADLIIIPQWATEKGEHYLIYYMVHELTHVFYSGHDSIFKKAEIETLEYFGINITYRRAYPSTLSYNGVEFYRHDRSPSSHHYRRARVWHVCDGCRTDIGYNDLYVTYKGRKYCGRRCMFADNPEYLEEYNIRKIKQW